MRLIAALLCACLLAVVGNGSAALTNDVKKKYIRDVSNGINKDVFSFWLKNGPDYGLGFHGTLDEQGKPVEPTGKGLIQEARHLYALTMYAEYFDPNGVTVKKAVNSLYAFLTSKMRDPKDGLFYFKVSKNGKTVEDKTKRLDANLYFIMAAARMGRVYKSKAALSLANSTFWKWDKLAHDSKNGGWLHEGGKSQDVAVHTLEALVELWRASPSDKGIRSRLTEAVVVLTNRVLLSAGTHSRKKFSPSWTPIDTPNTEFGHELVSAWMLLNLEKPLLDAKLITPTFAARMRARVLTNIKYTMARGWDVKNGGWWEAADAKGVVLSREKMWWQQAEGLEAMWKLYEVTGGQVYLDRAFKTAKWIWDFQRDKKNHEWWWAVNADTKMPGQVWPFKWKGLEWKASYHTGRVGVFMSRWTAGKSAY